MQNNYFVTDNNQQFLRRLSRVFSFQNRADVKRKQIKTQLKYLCGKQSFVPQSKLLNNK